MPFKSKAHRKFMYAKHPAIAKRWSEEYPEQRRLPEHVKPRSQRESRVRSKHGRAT